MHSTDIKLSHMGIFIRFCLLSSMWLSTGFLLRYTYVSAIMCNFPVSNAIAIITVFTTLVMSLLIYSPKALLPYKLYELLGICSAGNGAIGFFGPGECIPILPDNLKFSHYLSSFSSGMSLILIFLAPESNAGILTYEDKANDSDKQGIPESNNQEDGERGEEDEEVIDR